ncbi:MAG: hypothetical protein ACC657_03305 [Thiohalomonadales bacterium]
MILLKNLNQIFYLALITILLTACDEIAQTTDSSTIDRQALSYAYFINDTANHNAPTHLSISEVLALSCGASTCHGVGGGNGGNFKVYGLPLDSDAKQINNFIAAQAQVRKGQEDTSPTVTTNNYPMAHTSPILIKPLSELAGGVSHKGNTNADIFTTASEATNNAGGNDYGEIYRWIAFDQP